MPRASAVRNRRSLAHGPERLLFAEVNRCGCTLLSTETADHELAESAVRAFYKAAEFDAQPLIVRRLAGTRRETHRTEEHKQAPRCAQLVARLLI